MSTPDLPALPAYEGRTVLAVGIDLIEVERVRQSILRGGEHFLGRVFTAAERAYCARHAAPYPHYAARFAMKEAVSKALGTGMGAQFDFADAEIVRDARGAPQIALSPRAEELVKQRGGTHFLVSLTHLKETAAAVVLLVK